MLGQCLYVHSLWNKESVFFCLAIVPVIKITYSYVCFDSKNPIIGGQISRLPNTRMLNIWLNIKNNSSRKRIKIGESHATDYAFLRLW